ncbi:MAG: hypothetical protein GY719_41105 [bacterium]|nr:hypothetical protein [bacterium]
MTELAFDQLLLIVRPGPNEDYIVIEQGAPKDLDPQYWTPVEAHQSSSLSRFLGARLDSIELFTDGQDDVGLLFHFEGGESFSIVLCDTDLLFAEGLEPFRFSLEEIALQLRECIC